MPAESTTTMVDVADAIREFRQTLIDAGFVHANGAGELRSQDSTTWVGTSYVYGEYSIHAWRRPRGYGEIGEKRDVMRVRANTDLTRVSVLAEQLAKWAKKPPRGKATWPPKGLEA